MSDLPLTGTGGTDYTVLTGSVTIPAGSASAAITVVPLADTLSEGTESVVLTLAANAAYQIGLPSSATVNIADNALPSLPTVAVLATDANASEVGPDGGIFTLTRTGSTSSPLTVNYFMSGVASGGSDYSTLSGVATIPAGASSVTVAVTPLSDSLTEGSESAVMTISADALYQVGSPGSATVTIIDAPLPPATLPTVTISATDSSASESGGTGTFTVTRTGSTSSSLTINYTLSGSATNGTDYSTLDGNRTIAAGASSATIIVKPKTDSLVEGDESVTLTIKANAAYQISSPGSATVTITDAPPPPATLPTVTISATDSSASESGGAGTFTVTRTGSTSSSLTINYTLSGSATNGTDYSTLDGTRTIAAGASSATIIVTPKTDSLVEGDESVTLTIKANAAYQIDSPGSATVNIADMTPPPSTLPVVSITATDPNASKTGSDNGVFTVTRAGSTAAALTVTYSVSGSAISGTDYDTLSGSVTIPAGSSSGTIVVMPIKSQKLLSSKTVIVTLISGSSYQLGSPTSDTVTITN